MEIDFRLTCKKCKHTWIKRREQEPKACPNCNNRKWKEVIDERKVIPS